VSRVRISWVSKKEIWLHKPSEKKCCFHLQVSRRDSEGGISVENLVIYQAAEPDNTKPDKADEYF
jgi:hypothetical protein